MRSSKLDLNQSILKVATNLNPPFITYNGSIPKGGSEMTMLTLMSIHFNFKYELIDCHNDWGIEQDDHTWTGLIGKVASKEVDLGLSGVSVYYKRSKVVRYLSPHYLTAVSFITPPPRLGQSLEILVEPFDVWVWICLLLALLLMVFIVWLLSRYYPQMKGLSLKWFIISITLKQTAVRKVPDVKPLKLVLSGWMLGCLVFIQTYGSRLYSLMAFPTEIQPIDTVGRLAKAQRNSEIQVVSTKRSLYYDWLKNAEFGIYKDIGELMEPIENKDQGLEMVRDRTGKAYAFISTRDNLLYGVLRSGKRQYYVPPDNDDATLYFTMLAMPTRQDFPYIKQFNSFISHIIAAGLIDYWVGQEFRKLDSNYDLKGQDSGHDYRNLSFTKFKSVLLISIFINIVAVFVFVLENVLDRSLLILVLFKMPFN